MRQHLSLEEAERRLRRELALSCRILAAGQGDAIFGHVSARLPGWDRFWMKPAGLGLEEVRADDLILVDLDGAVLAGTRPRHEEYPIHAEVLRARPDLNCVAHTHPAGGIALPARGLTLLPVSHEATLFWPPGVPLFDQFTDLVTTRERGESVARALGDGQALFLLNHGVVVAGAGIVEATVAALLLERAAQIQLLAQPSPDLPVRHTSAEEAPRKRLMWTATKLRAVFDYSVRALGDRSGDF